MNAIPTASPAAAARKFAIASADIAALARVLDPSDEGSTLFCRDRRASLAPAAPESVGTPTQPSNDSPVEASAATPAKAAAAAVTSGGNSEAIPAVAASTQPSVTIPLPVARPLRRN
jgi:hypothetical protein